MNGVAADDEPGGPAPAQAEETGAQAVASASLCVNTMRVELIGHFKSCTTDVYLHI